MEQAERGGAADGRVHRHGQGEVGVDVELEEEYYEELREQRLKARADAEAEYERRVSGYQEDEWT